MATVHLVARRTWAPKIELRLGLEYGKLFKLLILFIFSGLFLGCASTQGTAFDRQLLLELEEKNDRLEAEVTRLREEKLRVDRKSDCSAGKPADPTASPDQVPANLPVVKMTPEADEETLASGAVMIRPAEPDPEEEAIDQDTRPVLKVHGSHEAWVYHRPLTAEDRKAKTDPAAETKSLPEKSN